MATFITFEGTEGCGKTTQAKLLVATLREKGHEVVATREPGGTDVTREIRRLLADPASQLDPRAELLLFLADRAQHVATVIRPALEAGKIVVCDRYVDSTLAYQGHGRGHELKKLEEWNKWASRDLMPDLTLWLDVELEAGLSRAQKESGGPGDRFEAEPLAFHRRIHDGFAKLAERAPRRIVRIDANREVAAIAADIEQTVLARLG